MKGNEELKELIAYYKHLFSHVWNALLLLTGGLVGLMLKSESPQAKAFITAGIPLWFALLVYALSLHIRARRLIRRLKDG